MCQKFLRRIDSSSTVEMRHEMTHSLIALYIPPPFFDYQQVGSADDISRGRSSFLMEMLETAHILQRATSRSLVNELFMLLL